MVSHHYRTDIVDTVLADYVKEFQKLYPNVKITYEAITDYSQTITTRLTTPNWGDIRMIRDVDKPAFSTYFISFDTTKFPEKYIFLNDKSFDEKVRDSFHKQRRHRFQQGCIRKPALPACPRRRTNSFGLQSSMTIRMRSAYQLCCRLTMVRGMHTSAEHPTGMQTMNQVLPHAKSLRTEETERDPRCVLLSYEVSSAARSKRTRPPRTGKAAKR